MAQIRTFPERVVPHPREFYIANACRTSHITSEVSATLRISCMNLDQIGSFHIQSLLIAACAIEAPNRNSRCSITLDPFAYDQKALKAEHFRPVQQHGLSRHRSFSTCPLDSEPRVFPPLSFQRYTDCSPVLQQELYVGTSCHFFCFFSATGGTLRQRGKRRPLMHPQQCQRWHQ